MFKKYDIVTKIEQCAGECCSFKELAEKTGFGRKTLREVFDKNPMLKNRVIGKLKDLENDLEEIEFPEGNKVIVLDASVIHATNLLDAIDIAIKSGFTFVLTSVTIKELDYASSKKDEDKKATSKLNAQRLLAKAVKEERHIIPIEIPECSVNPDDDILNAIKGKRENVILWTGDKAMVLKARMYKIRNVYIEDKIEIPKVNKQKETVVNNREETRQSAISQEESRSKRETIRTIFGSSIREDGKLYLSRQVNPHTTNVEVYDASGNRKELTSSLEIGDSILTVIARRDFHSVQVREEKVIAITVNNNAMLIFGKRIYDLDNLVELPEKYAEAVKRFLHE